MARRSTQPVLTPEQQAEADRIFAALQQAAVTDLRELANLLATKDDSSTFGATEYTVRDIALGYGHLTHRRVSGDLGSALKPEPVQIHRVIDDVREWRECADRKQIPERHVRTAQDNVAVGRALRLKVLEP